MNFDRKMSLQTLTQNRKKTKRLFENVLHIERAFKSLMDG